MDEIELERLSDEERAALAALPVTRVPDPGLENRVVDSLRERGLIWTPAPRSARPWRSLVAAAAALVMFAGGVLVGQRLEASEVSGPADLAGAADAPLGIADVRRLNEQWLAAVTRAGELSESADPHVQAQVREMLVDGLHVVAGVVVRFAPDEPVASEIFRGFAQIERDPAAGGEPTGARNVFYY